MDLSIFTDKTQPPCDSDLIAALGNTHSIWSEIKNYVLKKYPGAIELWNYPGAKYGWSYRLKDKKRAIIYLLPRKDFFMVAFVFGQKAFEAIMKSDIHDNIKTDLSNARVYAEGRGIRIEVRNISTTADIMKLIDFKLNS